MKKKLAIFDLDGTLFDTRRVNWLSYKEALAPFGVNLDYEYFAKECNGKHYKTFVPDLLRKSGNTEETIIEKMEQVHDKKKALYSNFLSETVTNKHLFEIIECIKKKYFIALVTTASKQNCDEILSFHKKNGLFDLVLTAENVTKKKPDPEGFLKAMEHFDLQGEDTLIFEDSKEGLEAAEKAGATVFAAKGFA